VVSRRVDVAEVWLWGRAIGAVYWDEQHALGVFEYAGDFQRSGIELAPLMMPLGPTIYRFPALARTSFQGLPGLLADSLPDDFGNAVIDQWLMSEGRDVGSFSPVERLCYIGVRGTGALEFRPATRKAPHGSVAVDISSLVALAGRVLEQRNALRFGGGPMNAEAMDDILRVGTSAGGARAKAVIAWNPKTGEMRSGQVKAGRGFEYWLLKFDGVENREHGVRDPLGFGLIEYAYHRMALDAAIDMADCRLLAEGERRHFMTRRFDRGDDGEKIHMQSLAAMAHLDHQQPGAHSYEQAMRVMQQLELGSQALSQQFRRMVFNVVARNQDDHTKNIAFLMDKGGDWRLAPAFDVIFAYNPSGLWTSRHQMSINGKRDDIVLGEFMAVARQFRIANAREIVDEVIAAVSNWPEYAAETGIDAATTERIRENLRLEWQHS